MPEAATFQMRECVSASEFEVKSSSTGKKTVILGLGNILLGDEGVGVQSVRYLQSNYDQRPDLQLLDGGTLSFTLVEHIEETDELIVIDATQMYSIPGTVRVFQNVEMDQYVMAPKKSSVHEVSLADLLVISHLMGHLPPRRVLIGIQPGTIDWSETLTEPVRQAIPLACEQAIRLITQWRQEVIGCESL